MTRFSTKIAGVAVAAVLLVGGATIAMPAQAATLTSSQISAIISLLQAFGADSTTILRVQASLQGQTVQPPQVGCSTYAHLKRGDTDWSTGKMVSALQRFLGVYPTTGYYGPITQGLWNVKCSSTTPTLAYFSATPTSGMAPLEVMFAGNANAGCGGGNFVISYGDGSSDQVAIPADACNASFSQKHTYRSAGAYTATLSRYVACLYSEPRCMMVEPAPIGTVAISVGGIVTIPADAMFSASPATGAAPLMVRFSGLVNSPGYSIDFGDGTTSGDIGCAHGGCPLRSTLALTNVDVSHTYSSPGTYTAKLRRHFTTNEGNCYGMDCNVVGIVTITVR